MWRKPHLPRRRSQKQRKQRRSSATDPCKLPAMKFYNFIPKYCILFWHLSQHCRSLVSSLKCLFSYPVPPFSTVFDAILELKNSASLSFSSFDLGSHKEPTQTVWPFWIYRGNVYVWECRKASYYRTRLRWILNNYLVEVFVISGIIKVEESVIG